MRAIELGTALVLVASSAQAIVQQKATEDPCQAANRALAEHRYETARLQYETCLKQAVPSIENLSNLGMAYAQLGQFDQAIKTYHQALALDPGNPALRMNLGLAYLKSGRTAEAKVEFARTLMADLNNAKAQELLALCHYQSKEFELAALEAERALSARPEEDSTAFLLGSAYLKLGLYREAIPLLYGAAQKTKSPETRLVLGEAFLGVKAYSSALKEFLAAEAASPETPGLHNDLGTAYAGLGQPDKAQAEFETQLAATPNDFEANYYLGRLKRLANDPEAAKQFLAKADRGRPGDPSVAYEYASFAMQDKNYARAEELLRGVLDKVPTYTDAHVLLAEAYYKLRRPDDARREKAIAEALGQAEQARVVAEGKAIEEARRHQGPPGAPHP